VKNWTIILLLIFASCSLNADQEASLHQAMVSYINSRNNGAVMSYVGFTHPNIVAHYKAQGDSLFQAHFDVSNEEERPFFQDGIIQEIESDGAKIHVKYEFEKYEYYEDMNDVRRVIIFAITENSGKSWFFAEEEEYFNDKIISKSKRLIKRS
jgi:hypothetical protein